MSKFGRDEEEDDVLAPKEPQVTSIDPEDRKAARSLRIKRRHDALKRAEQPEDEVCAQELPGLIEQATTTASEELQRLSFDGAATVTNVKVTTDEREVIRRLQFAKNMKTSLEKKEIEANEAQLQYETITSNWGIMLEIKDPLDIDCAMKEQKQKCDELIAQKNQLIDDLKLDLKRMDDAYYEDLEKQDRDIKELSERIEKQVTMMQRAYEKQLFLIEQAINTEREAMIDHNNKRWEALYKQRDKEEQAHMEYKFEQLEDNKEAMDELMWDHHGKYREAKIELETLIQELQKELEKLKAVCIINSEKIGYNYQVLKKREEENVFVRSQQKRKLNKMSDVANSLRSKIRKAAEDGAAEEIRADAEILKLMQAMADLENKSSHFSQVNDYKFQQVWRMSALRCSELTRELRHAETALHAHILAEPPPPITAQMPKSPLKAQPAKSADQQGNDDTCSWNISLNDKVNETKEKLVRHILQLVSDNTGFLIEDRLLKLIEKYQEGSKNLCTLDAIFMALEIQAEEDINLLCKTFIQYAFCPTCVAMDVAFEDIEASVSCVPTQEAGGTAERVKMPKVKGSVAGRSVSASTSRSAHVAFRGQVELTPSEQMLINEANEILQKCGDPQVGMVPDIDVPDGNLSHASGRKARGVTVTSQPVLSIGHTTNPFLCPEGHQLEIEASIVLTALHEFVSVFVPPEKQRLFDILNDVKPRDFSTISRRIKPDEINAYWLQWKNMFPPEKETFWDGVLNGLNNYLPILKERERLHEEVDQLRRKNAALRRLVRGALPELPPARPKYRRAGAPRFLAPAEDTATVARLPPI